MKKVKRRYVEGFLEYFKFKLGDRSPSPSTGLKEKDEVIIKEKK